MVKKIGVTLMGIFLVVIVGFNLVLYFSKDVQNSMSGMFISDIPGGFNISLIAFVLQWVILLMIVLFAYMRFLKHKKEEEQKIIDFIIPKPSSKAETNIDVLLTLLRNKKSLTTGTIAKAFNVTNDQALDWGKILEEHGLVTIEYPAFADPEIKYGREKTEEQKQEEKNKLKKIKEEAKKSQKNKDQQKNEAKKISEDTQTKTEQPKKEKIEPSQEDIGRKELAEKLDKLQFQQSNQGSEENLDQYKPK